MCLKIKINMGIEINIKIFQKNSSVETLDLSKRPIFVSLFLIFNNDSLFIK